ncbi:replication initiation protein [Tenacibaculum sp.]|uniref:replication initiation protein n=1 Tax=Tenacibaculum sp. TaxID=1906242 RepID=UPI003D0F8BC8
MKDNDKIKQPNHISTARFTLTVLEKNIIYTVIDELQKVMSRDLNQVYKEQEIIIELKKIDKNNNYKRIRNAVKSLATKQVEFELRIPGTGKGDRIQENITSLVSGLKYERKSQFISFMVPSSACRFFCYIGGGFTSFQKTIAISLSSIYSKSLYELCCRWSDKGGYFCSIEDFKEYLSISNKYQQISHLRHKVLDASIKELKQKADLFFSYSLKKDGRKYTNISIKIHRNTVSSDEYYGVKEEHYTYIYTFLSRFFPNYINTKALDYSEALAATGKIEKAYSRFVRLDDDFTSGRKTKNDICNLLTKIILPELGIKTVSKNQIHTQLKLSVN